MNGRMSVDGARERVTRLEGRGHKDRPSLTAARTIIHQAAQIERVREVLAWAEQAENRAHADWIRTADTHHRDAALAYTQAATWLRYALGDNDD